MVLRGLSVVFLDQMDGLTVVFFLLVSQMVLMPHLILVMRMRKMLEKSMYLNINMFQPMTESEVESHMLASYNQRG